MFHVERFHCYGSMSPGEPPKTRLSRIQTRSFGQDFRIQFPFGVPVGWRRLGSFCRKTNVCKDCSTQSWLSSTGYLLLCNPYGACDVIAFFQLFLVGWLLFFYLFFLNVMFKMRNLRFDPCSWSCSWFVRISCHRWYANMVVYPSRLFPSTLSPNPSREVSSYIIDIDLLTRWFKPVWYLYPVVKHDSLLTSIILVGIKQKNK